MAAENIRLHATLFRLASARVAPSPSSPPDGDLDNLIPDILRTWKKAMIYSEQIA